jgi:hypothetical protein
VLKNNRFLYIIILILIVAIVILTLVYFHGHSPNTETASGNSCVDKQFSLGSTGNCVNDIQTMLDFIETDGLTQCSFVGGKTINIDGSYSATTEDQIKVIQTWLNCYNHQEGQSGALAVNGIVNKSTWTDLCSYGYQFPSQADQSVSPFLKLTLQAGSNAGCSSN